MPEHADDIKIPPLSPIDLNRNRVEAPHGIGTDWLAIGSGGILKPSGKSTTLGVRRRAPRSLGRALLFSLAATLGLTTQARPAELVGGSVSYFFGGALGDNGVSQLINVKDSASFSKGALPFVVLQQNSDFGAGGAGADDNVQVGSTFGHLGASIRSSAGATGAGASVSNFIDARASTTDILMVTGLAAGRKVQLHQKLILDGTNDVSVDANIFGSAGTDLQVEVTGTGINKDRPINLVVDHAVSTQGQPRNVGPPKSIDQIIDLFMDIETEVTTNLLVSGNINLKNRTDTQAGQSAGDYQGDYINSLTYAPGAFFTDPDTGEVLTGITLTSGSGFDYLNPPPETPFFSSTPEPTTWALLLGGFGLAGAQLRRRRGKAAASLENLSAN